MWLSTYRHKHPRKYWAKYTQAAFCCQRWMSLFANIKQNRTYHNISSFMCVMNVLGLKLYWLRLLCSGETWLGSHRKTRKRTNNSFTNKLVFFFMKASAANTSVCMHTGQVHLYIPARATAEILPVGWKFPGKILVYLTKIDLQPMPRHFFRHQDNSLNPPKKTCEIYRYQEARRRQ